MCCTENNQSSVSPTLGHRPTPMSNHFTYETVHAPPATVFLHPLQVQMPTECRLTVFLPQNVQTYRACCVISIFLTCFRREAPYLYESSEHRFLARESRGRMKAAIWVSIRLTWCHIYQSHRPLLTRVSSEPGQRRFSRLNLLFVRFVILQVKIHVHVICFWCEAIT